MKRNYMNGVASTHVADLRCLVCGKDRDADATATLGPHKETRLKVMVHLGCTPGAKPGEAKAWRQWLAKMGDAISPNPRPFYMRIGKSRAAKKEG